MKKPSDEGSMWADKILGALESDNGQRIAICGFSMVATAVLLVFEGELLAYVFGLPYIFFIPGFAVVRLFFWRDASSEMRFVLSLGLSIIVVILLGLVLVLTPIGIDSDTTRASLILFTIGAVALETVYQRGGRAKKPDEAPLPATPPVKVDKVVASMIAMALVVSAISLGLVITADYPSRTYFAMTGEDGNIIANVSRAVNSSFLVNIEMKNGEDGPRDFMLVAYGIGTIGERDAQTFNRSLAEGEVWTQTIVFPLNMSGYFRIDFDLYIQNEGEPQYFYGNLHIWLSVLDEAEG